MSTKNNLVMLLLVSVGSMAVADQLCDVKIEIQGNFAERGPEHMKNAINGALAALAGNNEYQGFGYLINGTGACYVNAVSGEDVPVVPRVINCTVQGIGDSVFVIPDTVVGLTKRAGIEVGQVFSTDIAGLGQKGYEATVDGMKSGWEAYDKQRDFLGLLKAGLSAIGIPLSIITGVTAKAIGKIIQGAAVRVSMVYEIPRDIIQGTYRGVGALGEGNIDGAAQAIVEDLLNEKGEPTGKKTFGPVSYRFLSAVPSVFAGCDLPNEPADVSNKNVRESQEEKAGMGF